MTQRAPNIAVWFDKNKAAIEDVDVTDMDESTYRNFHAEALAKGEMVLDFFTSTVENSIGAVLGGLVDLNNDDSVTQFNHIMMQYALFFYRLGQTSVKA
ncbi:MAG: hypothetical protein EXS46_00190 [Candidatus Taylorbacteria bacterium]|nr:hypothetical protein [Candidatus Taylorbacteria bacterium]